jgi:predicted metal-dependent phosphoesterase TrpH
MQHASLAGRYDLHTHSSLSDGTTSPDSIVAEAAELGLSGIALTDHDTTDGWDSARAAANRHGIDLLPGIELTTRDGHRSTHLLAYGPEPEYPSLADAMQQVRDARRTRAERMVRRLAKDFRIDWEEMVTVSNARTIGRPHIADALVRAGHFTDRSTAFREVLHPGSIYYESTFAIDTAIAIGMVRAAGGVPVLAHPAATRQRGPVSAEAIERFAAAGLWGVELDHPENVDAWLPGLRVIAEHLGLAVTGASDYHGAGKLNRLGERTSSAELVAQIRAEARVPH